MILVTIPVLVSLIVGIVSAAPVTKNITYQGMLTDAAGNPLTGTYTMTFKLYGVSSGGSALATDTHTVQSLKGVFTTQITADTSFFDGRALWLGIKVGADAEMTPRQEIQPVPYSLSLRPGAKIMGSFPGFILDVSNNGSGIIVKTFATINSPGVVAITTGAFSPGVVANTTNTSSPGVYSITTGAFSAGVHTKTLNSNSSGVLTETTGAFSPAVNANTTNTSSPGVYLITTGAFSPGVHARTKNTNSPGVLTETTGAFSAGVHTKTLNSNSSGILTETTGAFSPAVNANTTNTSSPGVYLITTGASSPGVHAKTKNTNSHGVLTETTGNSSSGVIAVTTGPFSHGVGGRAYGINSNGVVAYSEQSQAIWAQTNRSDHKYGLMTPDWIRALGYETGESDIAEYMPITGDVTSGTVLVIGADGKLQTSTTSYDTGVAGIVSTAPGMSLGVKEGGNPGEALIAVAGRVPCKVDATSAPIHAGDLLTTSDNPGYAMKATNPQIGTILGKAMGTVESGTGTIDVLVTLQ